MLNANIKGGVPLQFEILVKSCQSPYYCGVGHLSHKMMKGVHDTFTFKQSFDNLLESENAKC